LPKVVDYRENVRGGDTSNGGVHHAALLDGQPAGAEEGGANAAADGVSLFEGGDWALEGPTAGRGAAGAQDAACMVLET